MYDQADNQQELIPVGCVPSAAVAVGGGGCTCFRAGSVLPVSRGGVSAGGDVCPGGGVCIQASLRQTPPPEQND